MVQTIPATKIMLYDLEQRFQLQQVQASSFFDEWQTELPSLNEVEKQRLARVQLAVANRKKRSLLENTVKLSVLESLLDLASLFFPPFDVSTEDSITIEATDSSVVIQGHIDILGLKEALWPLVIESKRTEFSPKVGTPQALSYVLASLQRRFPVYGLVTHSTDFIFLKMTFDQGPNNEPYYGRSRQFVLGQDHDLEQVLKIFKRLSNLLQDPQQ